MEVCILIAVITFVVLGPGAHAFVCPKYIFAFRDSLTDTSNAQAENPLFDLVTVYPYGESYHFPDRPCERTRFSDGRLIFDYTAQAFGIPFLEPNSRGFPDLKYSSGNNFAYSAGTARLSISPFPTFYLGREVDNYFAFRARFTDSLSSEFVLFSSYRQGETSLCGTGTSCRRCQREYRTSSDFGDQ